MKILLVRRDPIFSPLKVEADAAILEAVARLLEERGYEAVMADETAIADHGIPDRVGAVLQMTRGGRALAVLDKAAVPVLNAPDSVRKCRRGLLADAMRGLDVMPESMVCPTAAGVPDAWNIWPCWIKRADSQAAIGKDDVRMVQSAPQCADVMERMAARGIAECVLQENAIGKTVKFYAVAGCGIVGTAPLTEDTGRLWEKAGKAAQATGLEIYGGDAVVGADGSVTLVDLNDWPSFGCCRETAAQAIVRLLVDIYGKR